MSHDEAKNVRMDCMKNAGRIVVKVGTSTLAHSNGLLNLKRMEQLVRQIADIHNRGMEVVLVSSGAIAAGIGKLGLEERPESMPEKQAAAAVGQGVLMQMYQELFSEHGMICAQILMTREDMEDEGRRNNAKNTFQALLAKGAVPIVNENDAVAVEEIKFGDNDTLSAMVASLTSAGLLVILSDIDGMYDSNPKMNPDARLLKHVTEINEEIEAAADGAGSKLGTGGMTTKISAAKIALAGGAAMAIVNGSRERVILDLLEGKDVGTLFTSKQSIQED